MNEKKDLIIIMPLYNEATTIKETVYCWIDILNYLKINYQIRIYNDGSTDNSLEIVSEIAKTNSNIIIYNNKHVGFSKTIYNAYKEVTNTDYIFQADSDDEINPRNFKLFWENKENADIIIGKRINRNNSFVRFIASNAAKNIVSILFKKSGQTDINDVNIPFRLIKKNILDKITETIMPNYLYPNLYISAYCLANNIKIKEFPVEYNKPKRKSHLDNIIKLSIHEIISTVQLITYKLKYFT